MTHVMGAIAGPKRDIKARLNTPRVGDRYMQLKRRELLHAAAIAALAGCSERTSTLTEHTPTTEPPTETMTHGYGGHATTTTSTATSSTTRTTQTPTETVATESPAPTETDPTGDSGPVQSAPTDSSTPTPTQQTTESSGLDSTSARHGYGHAIYGGHHS